LTSTAAASTTVTAVGPWTRGRDLVRTKPFAVAAVAAIAATAVGVPALVGWWTGSLRLPHNDDWAYSHVALGFAATGHIHLVGWNQMTLIGHVLLAWPFLKVLGASQEHLNVAGAFVSTCAIVGSYLLARRFAPRGAALLVAATVAAMPGFSALSVTFMTDPSSFATEAAALALGVAAVTASRRQVALYYGALAVGIVSFTIRETAFAGLVAVTAVFLAVHRGNPRILRPAIAGACTAIAGIVVFYLWRQNLAGSQPMPLLRGLSTTTVGLVLRILFVIAFALLPLLLPVALSRRASLVSRLPLTLAAATAAVLGAAAIELADTPWGIFPGNYLTRLGATPQGVAGGAPVLFPPVLWWSLVTLGIVGSALAAALVADAARRRAWRRFAPAETMLAVFVVLNILILAFRSASQEHLYDRYAWPIVLALGALLAGRISRPAQAPRSSKGLAWLVVLAIGASGVAVAVNDSAASAGRWKAGEAAVALGYRPDTVDAGFEWMGAHAPGPGPAPLGLRATYPVHWYMVGAFPYLPNCVIVSYPTIAHGDIVPIGSVRYRSLLPAGEQTLHLYLNRIACPGALIRRSPGPKPRARSTIA